jgi:hypothetical protein
MIRDKRLPASAYTKTTKIVKRAAFQISDFGFQISGGSF